jgi:galactose mutarotase-like enzyme
MTPGLTAASRHALSIYHSGMAIHPCTVETITLERGVPAVRLRNPHVTVDVLPHKGADIYAITDARTGIDVLWKSPLGVRPPNHGYLSKDSATAWLEQYEGGWQEILPNAGAEHSYKGVPLSFHGESTLLPWDYTVQQSAGGEVAVAFSCQLYRSPFRIEREMRMTEHSAAFTLRERVTNLAGEAMDFMWGHHPAYGAPFVSEHLRVCTNARRQFADGHNANPFSPLAQDAYSAWPHAAGKDGGTVDLRTMPPQGTRSTCLAYLMDFDGAPWYALINPALRLGVGVAWSGEVFKHLWYWQEMHASAGFPFYSRSYALALEPHSSYPHELVNVMNTTRTHLTLAAGASLQAWLTFSLFDPDGATDVRGVNADGSVRFA